MNLLQFHFCTRYKSGLKPTPEWPLKPELAIKRVNLRSGG